MRFAAAAHIDAQAGIAVTGEIGMGQGVARGGAVAFAIGQIFENRRHRIVFGVGRQPGPRRQAAVVGQGDPQVLDLECARMCAFLANT